MRRDLTAPLAVGRHVVLGDVQGFMHVLSRETGAVVGRATTDGSPIVTQPVLLGESLLLQTTNGGIYAYSVE
jgi:outer membrane protein assembly factor BamB